jgi:hypothetical protein
LAARSQARCCAARWRWRAQPLAAGERLEMLLGDGAVDYRLGGVEMGGELRDAPAVIQQGLQTGTQVGEAQPSGLLLEVALVVVHNGEAAVDDQLARQLGW